MSKYIECDYCHKVSFILNQPKWLYWSGYDLCDQDCLDELKTELAKKEEEIEF
jgi:hypothetical protein